MSQVEDVKKIIAGLSPDHVSINKEGHVVIRDAAAVEKLQGLSRFTADEDGNSGCTNTFAHCVE